MSTENLQQLAESQKHWVVEAEGDCFSISNDEGVDAVVYKGEQQIIIETVLFPASQVMDTASMNDLILRSHHLVPLSTICIKEINGESYYVAFGALSKDSKDSVILEEIETLFSNVDEFLELYSELLNSEAVA